jgi:hypothetical protein
VSLLSGERISIGSRSISNFLTVTAGFGGLDAPGRGSVGAVVTVLQKFKAGKHA